MRIAVALLLLGTSCTTEALDLGETSSALDGLSAADVAISTTALRAQDHPAAAVASDATTLVVYRDASPAAVDPDDGGDIRGRFVSADGVPLGADFVINTTTAGTQDRPDVAVVNDDYMDSPYPGLPIFLVVWQDGSRADPDTSGSAVRARRVVHLGGGSAGFYEAADFVVPARRGTAQTMPAVAATPDRNFLVTWQDRLHTVDPAGAGVRLRRVPRTGLPAGGDLQVNSTTAGDQTQPDLAVAPDGTFFLAWTDGSDAGGTTSTNIRARRLSAGGAPHGTERRINSTTAGAQSLPALAFDASDASYVVAWADGSAAAPDTSSSAVRVRRYPADSIFEGPDEVINVTVKGGQSQPAMPPRAESGLLFAFTSPDGSSLGIRSRLMIVGCPAHEVGDFFADPRADRTTPGLPAPTGVRRPAVCAFPTLGEAITAASRSIPKVRAVASHDSTPAGEIVEFTSESFPWFVAPGVLVTTTDDPWHGGGGFDPDRFIVTVDDNAEVYPASVYLLGAASRSEAGGGIAGLTLAQGCSSCPPVAVRVEGFGDESTPRLDAVRVRGAGAGWTTGVEVQGNGVVQSTRVDGFTASAGAPAGIGLHVVDDNGTEAADRVVVSDVELRGNNVGLQVSGGRVEAVNCRTASQISLPDGTSGDGIVLRDWWLDAAGTRIVTPTTFTSDALIAAAGDGDGVEVDLVDPGSTVELEGLYADQNSGSGVRVLGAPHADAPIDTVPSTVTEYGLVVVRSQLTRNGESGIELGAPDQSAQVVALIGDVDRGNSITDNLGPGLVVRQSAPAGSCPTAGPATCTGATLMRNGIDHNEGPGIRLETSILIPYHLPDRPGWGRGFLGNAVYNNGSSTRVGCNDEQTAPQILVDGPTALPPGICDDQVTEATCDLWRQEGSNHHCMWTGSGCAVGWDLRAGSDTCDIGSENKILGYNTIDTSPFTVGVYAANNAFVMADGSHWQESATADQHVSWQADSLVDVSFMCGFLECSGN